jgi:predicted AAA+ superfamily ATPase
MEPALLRALTVSPVVVLTGARQTGKSTLVRRMQGGSARDYRTLDDLDVLAMAERDPDALINASPTMTIDEVQRVPRLLLAVKRSVDGRRIRGRFLLTGSANIPLRERVSESLAGRAIYLTLQPLTRGELQGKGTAGVWGALFSHDPQEWPGLLEDGGRSAKDWRQRALAGGLPVPALQMSGPGERALWFQGYAQTYLERDVQQLSPGSSRVDFRRLMKGVCLRLGTVLNQSELGRDLAISQPTVHRYLNLLEESYQLNRIPAFAVNRTKRLIKSPKVYWNDTGLAMDIAGETEPRGCHLENLIVSDLVAWKGTGVRADVCFWRTTAGDEVDLVVEHDDRLLPIEVKSTPRPRMTDARHLLAFRKEYGKRALPALLLHTGTGISWITEGVLAAPWWMVV